MTTSVPIQAKTLTVAHSSRPGPRQSRCEEAEVNVSEQTNDLRFQRIAIARAHERRQHQGGKAWQDKRSRAATPERGQSEDVATAVRPSAHTAAKSIMGQPANPRAPAHLGPAVRRNSASPHRWNRKTLHDRVRGFPAGPFQAVRPTRASSPPGNKQSRRRCRRKERAKLRFPWALFACIG